MECQVCKAPATTTLRMTADTVRALNVQVEGNDTVELHVCAGCYLRGTGYILSTRGLPKQEPIPIEYWCDACQSIIEPTSVVFVGHQKVTPAHETVMKSMPHILVVRASRKIKP